MRILMSILALFMSTSVLAAEKKNLTEEIYQADQAFFTAFNACDLKVMGNVFSRDLEFYHDISGYAGYEQTMAATKNNCDRKLGLVRTLVKDSMTVHALGDFGAMQKGRHTFCHLDQGKNDCGTFEFMNIWKRHEGNWKLHRAISYGH
jgi:ketosteroid isomerase-like protein